MQPKNKKEPKKRKEKKKRVLIQLRTNEDEKMLLQILAKEAGMTITDFVKYCTLGKAPRIKIATPIREIFIRLLAELGKIGSNVDQIGKIMNSENGAVYSSTLKEIGNEVFHVIRKAANELLSQLENRLSKWQGVETISCLGVFMRLLHEFREMGLSVNQIAKVMNTEKGTGYSVTVKESVIVDTLDDIRKASNELLNHLEHGIGKGQSEREREPACDLSTDQSG